MVKKLMSVIITILIVLAIVPSAAAQTVSYSSSDAYISFDDETLTWTFGTSIVEKKTQIDSSGRYLLTSFVNKLTGRDYIQNSAVSDEFALKVGTGSIQPASGSDGGWQLVGWSKHTGEFGILELEIILSKDMLEVTRNYRLLPQTGVIEEWSDFKNISGTPQQFSELRILRARLMTDDASNVELYYMSGDKNSSKGYYKMQPPTDMDTVSGLTQYTGNGGDQFQPFGMLYNRKTSEGIFMTWDYTGTWTAKFGNNSGRIFSQVSTAGGSEHEFSVADGESVSSPLARMGVFTGDLDDMGNAITDYQYRYKWKHTNEKYMNNIRFGGYGYSNDILFDKINLNRYLGGDMLWIDDGWQTYLGDWEWNGTRPVNEYQDYLKLSSMTLGMWLVPWGVISGSELAAEHPEWCINLSDKKGGLKVELSEVQKHIRNMLNARQQEFGTFMLKTDFNQNKSTYPRATAVMEIIKNFKEDNPQAGITLCSDGGGLLNPGTAEYSEIIALQDGASGLDDGYWVSMLYPVDKIMTSNGRASLGEYTKSNRAIMSGAFTVATTSVLGQTGNLNISDAEMELVRQDADLYRWLCTQGVMGRFVKVYRPDTTSQNKYYFMQKMSPDSSKGYMTVRFDESFAGEELVMYPKGLIADMTYTVSSLENGMKRMTKTGAELMAEGIALTMKVGEVLFFNLENHPGNNNDTLPPSEPSDLIQQPAAHLGFEGMELSWSAAEDNNWISYYEILKNGQYYTKVSAGTYYFDEDGTTEDVYEVRSVDGGGNKSDIIRADGAPDGYPADDNSFKPYYEIVKDGGDKNEITSSGWDLSISSYSPDGSTITGKTSGNTNQPYPAIAFNNITVPENSEAVVFWFGQQYQERNSGENYFNDPKAILQPKFRINWREHNGTYSSNSFNGTSGNVYFISTDTGKVLSTGVTNAPVTGTTSESSYWPGFKNGYVVVPLSLLAPDGKLGDKPVDIKVTLLANESVYLTADEKDAGALKTLSPNTIVSFDNFGFITDMDAFLADCGEVSGKEYGKNTYVNSSAAYRLGVLPESENATAPLVTRSAGGLSVKIPEIECAEKYVFNIYTEENIYIAGTVAAENRTLICLDTSEGVKVQVIAVGGSGKYLSVSRLCNIAEYTVLKGDVNGDGTVDIKDLIRLKKYLAGTETAISDGNADLDKYPEQIDSGDLAALKKLLMIR